MGPTIYKELSKAVLVDSTALRKLDTSVFQETMADIYAIEKPVKYVETFAAYKLKKDFIPAILRGEDVSERIEFFRDTPLTDDEQRSLTAYAEGYKAVEKLINDLPAPAYPFATIPEGRSIDQYYFTDRSIARHKGSSYSIGIKTLQKLWDNVKLYWYTNTGRPNSISIQASGYGQTATFEAEKINLGCQHIDRWELEQVAVKYNWEFPS
jgi:hypothetical protein